jgi:uncharacterized protein
MHSHTLHKIAFLLLVVGGINWLLVGLLSFDLVGYIGSFLGSVSPLFNKVVFTLVGLSAIYELLMHKAHCKVCSSSDTM